MLLCQKEAMVVSFDLFYAIDETNKGCHHLIVWYL